VRRRKAPKPASAGAVSGPRTRVSAGTRKQCGAHKTFDPSTQVDFLAVYSGQRCLGFLLPRGNVGIEAFDADDKSLGLFPNQKAAADALSGAAP
jgi:hypothetical protein